MGIRFAVVTVALLALITPSATAQPPYPVFDYCFAIDHFPDETIDDAPSIVGFYASVGRSFGGGSFTFSYDGASGAQMGSGPIDANGIAHGYGPLFSYGGHSLTGGSVTNSAGNTYDLDVSGLTFEVDDDEPMCDADDLSVVDDAPETTTTSTTTTTLAETTITTAETTTTTEAPTTVTSAPPPEESPVTSIQIVDDEGNSYTAWWFTGGILLVIGGGLWFFAREDEEDCIPLKAAWLRAKQECEEAEAEVERRKKVLGEAEEALEEAGAERRRWQELVDEIQEELDELKRARGSSVTSGGTTFHRIAEGLVTAEGLEDIINSVEARLQNAKDNVPDVTQSELDWQKRVADQKARVQEAEARAKELCAKAAAAKKAYEDCIKGPAGPDDGGTGDSGDAGDETGTGTGGTGTGGTGTGTGGTGTGTGGGTSTPPPPTPPTAPPSQPSQPGCTNGTKRNERITADQTFRVAKNTAGLELSVTPSTDEFDDWLEEQQEAAGGIIRPNRLLDPAFPGEVRDQLRGLDTGLSVGHEVRVGVPQQDIRYICVEWEECVNGAWVARKERRESGRSDAPNQVFSTGGGKTSSREVLQLIARARGYYQQLARTDESIEDFCN